MAPSKPTNPSSKEILEEAIQVSTLHLNSAMAETQEQMDVRFAQVHEDIAQQVGQINSRLDDDKSVEDSSKSSSLLSQPTLPDLVAVFQINPFEAQIEELKDEIEVEEPKVELKVLPSHLKYVFLEKNENKAVIISNTLSKGEEEKLLGVLERNQEAMGWTLSDLKGISPSFCMHKISMEDDFKQVAQPQRRLNPVMKEVVRKEVVKMLEAGMIYPISDSAWVSPVHVVPKKGGMTVIRKEKNELIPSRTVTGWRMFNPEDHEKTAFTCPFGIFAYRRMPFELCNAPATFQRCMQAIFSDLIEKCIEVFMDDLSVFGASFDLCLKNLDTVLSRCVESNLVLNWEKCNFMVTEGIVLGHKVSSRGLEVDKAKI
ncbi:uncharacterized protein LOC131619164 [Vicia villosa]|uniref:uncharacterized protein LOC131619164 n=1 Tax=Vicia villosa TaxID=3911 RepID=UPI00273BCD41|nr:uncharacterized protein LOC131619164 [Vicia villosa]